MFTYSLGKRVLSATMPWKSTAINNTVATCSFVCVFRDVQALGAPAPSKWLATFSGSWPCCQSAWAMVAKTSAKKAICSRAFMGSSPRGHGTLHPLERLGENRTRAAEVEADEFPCRRAVLRAVGEANAVLLKEVAGVVQLQG